MTAREKLFVKEYLVDLCPTNAARRAGYAAKSANREGPKILRRPHIAAAVAAATEERLRKLDVKTDRIIEELARIAYFDLTRVVDLKRGRVTLKELEKVSHDDRRAIGQITETVNGIGIKSHDKIKALELLGKYLGIFVDRIEHEGIPESGPLVVVMPDKPD